MCRLRDSVGTTSSLFTEQMVFFLMGIVSKPMQYTSDVNVDIWTRLAQERVVDSKLITIFG